MWRVQEDVAEDLHGRSYYIGLYPESGYVRLFGPGISGSVNVGIRPDVNYEIMITMVGNNLKVHIDNNLIFDINIDARYALPEGFVGVRTWHTPAIISNMSVVAHDIQPPQVQPDSSQSDTVVRFEIGSTLFHVNGVSSIMDVPPFIDPAVSRTMIPLRVVAEAFGVEVDWVGSTQTVLLFTDAGIVELPVGVPLPGGMGTAVIIDSRTLVPLRYVLETFGATVRGENNYRVIYVYHTR